MTEECRENRKSSFRNSFLFPLLAIMIAVTITATGLEIILRLAGYSPGNVNPLKAFHNVDPLLGIRGKKNYASHFRRPEFDAFIVHNERGFRKQEFLAGKNDTIPSIHALGDSFTWGWGVSQGEVFTDRLNRALKDYRVENYGINSAGTVIEYVLFASEIKPAVKPGDVVLLMLFNNDFTDNVTENRVHAKLSDGNVIPVNAVKNFKSPVWDYLENNFYLYNLIAYKIDTYQLVRKRRKREIDDANAKTVDPSGAQYRIMQHYLKLFRDDCSASGVRFMVAYIPAQSELGESDRHKPNKRAGEQAYRTAFNSITSSLGVETIDLLPQLLDYKKRSNKMITFPHDEHWSPDGHQAVAEAIALYMKETRQSR